MYEDALCILKKLNEKGYDAYIVGGYPRDKYLGVTSHDFDICTVARPEEIKKIFTKTDVSYASFGRVDVYLKSNVYQITTYRRDVSYDFKRMPKIEYVNNLLEDLKRRDFVINTLAIDSNGIYVDLLDARTDLNNKIIRTVKNPGESIAEDPLRILRAIRFSLKLGFEIDTELSKVMHEKAHTIFNVSSNKVKDEVSKILLINESKSKELLKEYNLSKLANL